MADIGNAARLKPKAAPGAGNAEFIRVTGVGKSFAQRDAGAVPVLDGVNLAIAENEFISLVGRSGCGKTTLDPALVTVEGQWRP